MAADLAGTVEVVCAAMAHVLMRPVEPGDDFLALGGDSLLTSQLCAELVQRTGEQWRESDVVQSPTPAGLAARLGRGHDLVVPLRTTGTLAPLLVVFGPSGYVFGAQRLAAALGPDQPVYAVQPRTPTLQGWDADEVLAAVISGVPGASCSVVGVGTASRGAHPLVHGLEAAGRSVTHVTYVDVRPWPADVTGGPLSVPLLALLPRSVTPPYDAWRDLTTAGATVTAVESVGGRMLHEPTVGQVARLVVAAQLRASLRT